MEQSEEDFTLTFVGLDFTYIGQLRLVQPLRNYSLYEELVYSRNAINSLVKTIEHICQGATCDVTGIDTKDRS